MSKIVLTNKVMDDVFAGKTVNEALQKHYFGEIQDKIKENSVFAEMTPMQMALYDAGVTKDTMIGDILNQSTITTQEAGEWLFPAYIDTTLHEIIQKNDVLQYVAGSVANAQAMFATSCYLDMNDAENKDNAKKARVAEGADLPLAKLKLGESAIALHKYGRAVEQTYEAMKLMRVDMFAKALEMIANDAANQELDEAVRVALNGDGNKNAATSLSTTTTSNVITADELTDALFKYWKETGMSATTIIAGDEMFLSLYKMMYQNNMSFGANSKFTFDAPQIPGNALKLIYANVPKVTSHNVAIVLNKDMSLTKHILNGSKIQEYATNIRNQTKLGTISEISGFSKNLPDGVKLITSK